ncbi:hypothetical protein SORBI_3003G135201, partial [Sorghum bicolor]
LFRGRDIYDVIEKAILVAATDSPHEFRRRRDGIVGQIYTARTVPAVPQGRAAGERSGRALEVSDKAGSKLASCTVAPAEEPEDNNDKKKGIAAAQHGNGDGDNNTDDTAYGAIGMEWLQSLSDQMDAETQEINEVLRIKEILLNHPEQSVDNLFDSLRRLQLMQLTADKIKSTEIGGAIVAVSKHKSHKIRMLVHEIIKDWKAIVDDWIAATKATMDSDSNKDMDISNAITTEDEVGLATPPMDIGALYLVSHATEIQNVSEFLHGMDDETTTTNLSMDKGGGCRPSNSRFDGFKPSSSTTPWSKDPVVVQALPAIRGPQPFDNGNPQELPGRKRRRSRNTNPLITFKKTQEEGSQVPRVRIKVNHSSTECAPRELVEKTLVEKKSYEENQGPISAAKELPPGQVLKKGMPTQSSAGPKVGTSKRKVQLTEMDIDETKHKLRGAYQEAEKSKQRRAIQVMELSDIAKSRQNHVVIRTPSTNSMNPTNRTHKMNRSQIIKSWENDRCK